MSDGKIQRPLVDLVRALARHVKLLREYTVKAFDERNEAYLGEVVGKLRLLVGDRGGNIPLLLRLAKTLDIKLTLVLSGPPMKPDRPGDAVAGDTVSLREFLGLDAGGVALPRGEWVKLTKIDLVHMWAQQYGAAHEDWRVDERFVAFRNSSVFIGGYADVVLELRTTTHAVLHAAEMFFAHVTPERVTEAEAKRKRPG